MATSKLSDLEMAKRIAQKVSRQGGRTFYVGGFVRDRIRGKENKDVDIEVHGITPEALEEILNEVGHPTRMGASFGIFGLKGYDLDIAMPRKETAIGRGHKDFMVLVDPFIGTENAAKRRDFTMNALMEDVLTGETIDHFGGISDMEQGILRHVNDDTFVEDPLRVLRGAQFAARFGFTIAPETVALAKTMDLTTLARERIWGELEKAFEKADTPSVFFVEMDRMDQLDDWFPEVKQLKAVPQNPVHHPEGDVFIHTMRVLDQAATLKGEARQPIPFMTAALCHDFGKITATRIDGDGRITAIAHEEEGLSLVKTFLGRITGEIKLTKYVLNMTRLHMKPNRMAADGSKASAMNRLYDESVCPEDLLLLAKADHLGKGNEESYPRETADYLNRHLADYRELMTKPQVMGADLVAAGLKPGPEFSELLAFAHQLHLCGVPKEAALAQTLARRIKE